MNAKHEQGIQTAIIHFIRAIGGYCEKVQSGGLPMSYTDRNGTTRFRRIKLASKGTPDILACIKGKFVAIEVKRDAKEVAKFDKRATDPKNREFHQNLRMEDIRLAGGVTLIAASIEDVAQDLKELKLL